jgi:outer membrane lipoprotein-sorting protein
MRRIRTLPSRRLWAILAAVAALAAGGGIAQAALRGASKPAPRPLDHAVLDALRAPAVDGITARIRFTDGLLPSGSLQGKASPLLAGASGRLWLASGGRARAELQSDSGDVQVLVDGDRVRVYDAGADTAYRLTLPAGHDRADHARPDRRPTLAGVRDLLHRLSATWNLSGARPTTTADRPSYTVRISPRDDGGLLGAAELAWDAQKGVPLRAAVYAQGQSDPVLALEATHISYGPVPASDLTPPLPRGTKVVNVDVPAMHGARPAHGTVKKGPRGVNAVRRALDFPLAAPRRLAGLPRTSVRLVRLEGKPAAFSTYGRGLGAIAVVQQRASGNGGQSLPGGVRLPRINIDGATGSELATPLGTVVTFKRGEVAYVVAGSVPPLAAENAARGLR